MKLCQILAIEKGTKQRVYSEISELHKANQKPALFVGFDKTYSPLEDGGETYPPESQKVQRTVAESLATAHNAWRELFDIVAAKDHANCTAKANVVVDGKVLLEEVPATYLLFLEKQLVDIRQYIEELPVLDQTETWSWDDDAGYYRAIPVTTHRTKKVARPIVLYPATPEHPAQTNMITEDILAGHWKTVKVSGAMSRVVKTEYLVRVNKLLDAVKVAREEANTVAAPEKHVGEMIFRYLF